MTLKELSQLLMDKEFKDSTIPLHARVQKKFSDKSANDLTKAILGYFKLKDIFAHRQSSEGRYRPGKEYTDVLGHKKTLGGMFIPGTNKGSADVKCVIQGRAVEVEVKHGKDKLRPDQIKYKEAIEKSGGIYLVVKTWDDFIYQITRI